MVPRTGLPVSRHVDGTAIAHNGARLLTQATADAQADVDARYLQFDLNHNERPGLRRAGETTLDDGAKARVLKAGFSQSEDEALPLDAYYMFTVREDDKTIVKKEFFAGDQSLLLVKRVLREPVEQPGVPWDLAGVADRAEKSESKLPIKIMPDMVRMSVTIEAMIETADFETYVFRSAPPWAGDREITDILDVASPPRRMFAISYRVADRRHVVLIQSPSYNKAGGAIAKEATLAYESPNGVKVWTGPRGKWLAGILLKSARAAIKDPPAENRSGYLLETPAGTYPALAINGQLTDDELHALVDSLVPASTPADQ